MVVCGVVVLVAVVVGMGGCGACVGFGGSRCCSRGSSSRRNACARTLTHSTTDLRVKVFDHEAQEQARIDGVIDHSC